MGSRRILAVVVACIPIAPMRRWLYGLMRCYTVDRSATIGWLTVIAVERLNLGPMSRIGSRCRLQGPMTVSLGEGSAIGNETRIECGSWSVDPGSSTTAYAREFLLGEKAMTTSGHFFDATGGVYIGEGSWIAGFGSQFWTHGLGAQDRSISIGRYCYIGSAVRFAPGARVGDLNVVSIGSVVTRDMAVTRQALIGGVPAAVILEEYRPRGWGALDQAIAEGAIAYEVSS